MNAQYSMGVVLLVIGVVLFLIGQNASDSFADQWSEFFTGHYTDSTVWYMVGGLGAALAGTLFIMSGVRRSRAS